MSKSTLAKIGDTILTPGKYEWHDVLENGVVVFHNGTPEEYWHDLAQEGVKMFIGSMGVALKAKIAIGTILAFGEGTFKERYANAIDTTQKAVAMSIKTLENVASVVGSIAPENWHLTLDWSHHAVVSRLEAPAQKEALDKAENEAMSVSTLKKYVKDTYPKTGTIQKPKTAKVILDMNDEKSILLGLEKIADYMHGDKCGAADMADDRVKEFRGRILAIVEGFGITMDSKFFERLTTLAGAYLDENEAAEPIREWSKTRKERWADGLNSIAKAGRRGGLIGAAKPRGEKEEPEKANHPNGADGQE